MGKKPIDIEAIKKAAQESASERRKRLPRGFNHRAGALTPDPHLSQHMPDNKGLEPCLISRHSLGEPWEYLDEADIVKFYGQAYLDKLLADTEN